MKVTIIGASISGLFSAYLLAKEGVEVEVYERVDALDRLSRTLIVTSKLNEVLGFVPEEAITNKVRYLEIFSKSRSARLELTCPDLVIERKKLLKLLARLAEGAGAKISLKNQFEGFAQFGRKIVVVLRNLESYEVQKVSTDILIGADGALSSVAQTVSQNGHYLTALLQAKVLLPEGIDSSTCQVWFDSNQTKYFYWLIPESRDTATAGLIADDEDQAKASLGAFLKERKLKPLEFQEAMVPLHRFGYISDGQIDRNVFLVGDAAAQVKVTTVGGVVTGLYGARALANALLNGRNYIKELRGLKFELDLHLLMRHVLNRFKEEDYDKLIAMIDGGLRGILVRWTRDELRQSFFRLIFTKPQLVSLGTRAFLRSLL